MDRSADWMAQARRDVENAEHCREGAFFEWATFASQQGAGKAIKAVYQKLGGDAWGHSCFQLLQGLADDRSVAVGPHLDAARLLDRFYIPARYPNGWGSGAPKDLITRGDADDAVAAAKQILRFCQGLLAGS